MYIYNYIIYIYILLRYLTNIYIYIVVYTYPKTESWIRHWSLCCFGGPKVKKKKKAASVE